MESRDFYLVLIIFEDSTSNSELQNVMDMEMHCLGHSDKKFFAPAAP